MLNDLTYGATLTACLVGLVATVWMEATSPSAQPTAAAAAHAKAAPAQPAKNRDKDCAALVAAAATTDR